MDGKSECILLSNKPYIFLVLASTFIMFAVAAIQYWTTFFFVHALNCPKDEAFIYFCLVSITAPVIGTIISAFVTDKMGGYTSKNTLPWGFTIALLVAANSFMIVIT